MKLPRARSLLYRHRSLQVNTHWKAFFEIYKICNQSHRSDLKICCKMSIYLQRSVPIQRRTSPPKFDILILWPSAQIKVKKQIFWLHNLQPDREPRVCKLFQCPFSAVSKPFFASKYSFFSIFQDLQSPLSGGKKKRALFFPRKRRYSWRRATV